jgi:hypothetical protein
MATALFIGSKLKIKRADQHIQELASALNAFLQTDFYQLIMEPNLGNGTTIRVECRPIPEDIPLIIGDAIHNLRSALDLMHCEIITRAGGTPTTNDAFRVVKTRDALIGALNEGEIKRAGATIIDLIVDTIRPYREAGGNDAICALHDLDIVDKHRLILPIFGVGGSFSAEVKAGGYNVEFSEVWSATITGVGREHLRIASHTKPTFSILFGEGPFHRQSVAPMLHQLSKLVSGIVEAIEKAHVGANTP